jgi:hypothetical protein
MAKASPAFTSFNAGELSPYMEGRVDQARYQNGAHTMENFQALVQGPAMRRAGFRFVTPVKNSAFRTFLRPFVFSITQAFVLEFGDRYIRFYTNHGQVQVSGVAAWSNATAYAVGALVSQGGVNYYCTVANTGNAPPNAGFWYALSGTIYEIPSPWAGADLIDSENAFALKIEQSGDVLYIAGGAAGAGYQPQTLTRLGDTDWVLAPFSPPDGPFAPANNDRTLAIWSNGISGTVTISASRAVFAATDVGRLIRIAVQTQNTPPWTGNANYAVGNLVVNGFNVYKALNTATAGPDSPIHISGTAFDGKTGVQWLYMDSGYGIVQITGFTDSQHVTANVLTQLPAGVVGNSAAVTGVTQANPAVVTAINTFAQGDTGFVFGLNGMTQLNNQIVTLTAVSGTTATLGSVNSTGYSAYVSGGTIVDNATTEWSLGAWSNTSEWPRVAKFFRNRLWWLGQLSVNGSVPGLYTSYALDTAGEVTDNNAISLILSFDDVDTICWASPLDRFLIGTNGGEFALYEQTTQTPLGPDNVQIVRQSKKRCHTIDPVIVNTTLLYVQRAGRKLLAMDYDFTIDKYKSTDQSVWAYHMSQGGFTDMCFQAEPWSTVWLTRPDGTLVGFTFDREQEVYAWHRHVPGATAASAAFAESVCSVPAPDGSRDELWLTVNMVIGGQTVRFVEFQEKIYEDGDAQSSCFYVDAGATYSGPSTITITGLSYLRGETVAVLVNGAAHPNEVVSATGEITLQNAGTIVQVGLPCPAILVTERPEAGADVGTSQGKTKRTQWAALRLYNTLGGFVGMDGGQLDELQYRTPLMPMDQPPPLFTGDQKLGPFAADYDSDQRFRIEQDQPFPMTIIGFFPSITGYEPT